MVFVFMKRTVKHIDVYVHMVILDSTAQKILTSRFVPQIHVEIMAHV